MGAFLLPTALEERAEMAQAPQPSEMLEQTTRRGFIGTFQNGTWTPLPIMGGDETSDAAAAAAAAEAAKTSETASKTDDEEDLANWDKERAAATIKAQRQTEKDLKRQLTDLGSTVKQLTDKVTAAENEKLSESDKVIKERDELKTQLADTLAASQERIIRSEVRLAAQGMGFNDPEDAWRFVTRDDIKTNEAGEPQNLKELLEKLLKDKPYLKGAATTDTGKAGVPPTAKGANGSMTRDELIADKKKKLLASRV